MSYSPVTRLASCRSWIVGATAHPPELSPWSAAPARLGSGGETAGGALERRASRHRQQRRAIYRGKPRISGQGNGKFAAYAADSGRKLWSIRTGSAINAVPVTFDFKGEQYIVGPVGWGSIFRLFAPASMMVTSVPSTALRVCSRSSSAQPRHSPFPKS